MRKVNFLDFLSNNNQFIVPFNYDSFNIRMDNNNNLIGKINSDSLNWDNLYFYEEDQKHYFADGVKRFTALYLLLSAICSKFYENNEIEKYENILNNHLLSEENESKLVLKDKDNYYLKKIINGIKTNGTYLEDETYGSKVLKTYHVFHDWLIYNEPHKDYMLIYENLNKIKIPVKLIPSDDSVKTFRKCNENRLMNKSKQHILIKNYFLEHLEDEHINDFKRKWKELEELEVIYNRLYDKKITSFLNNYLKIYLNVKIGITVNEEEIYNKFIDLVNENGLKETYEDIYKYGSYYKKIFMDQEENNSLNICFKNINNCCLSKRFKEDEDNQRYSYDEIKVFLLKVYDDYKHNIITSEDLTYITKCLESYIIRRDICDFSYNNLNKTFDELYDNLEEDNYINSFTFKLTNLDENIFPDDTRIVSELQNHDFFNEEDIKKYILDSLENSLREESINLDRYQIEHVMPQTLNDDWKKRLGENNEIIHKKYKNTIGNLTLLEESANKSLHNSPFKIKVNKKGIGYKYSDIRLSDDIIQSKEWNEKTIRDRSKKLAKQIIKIWPYPEIDDDLKNLKYILKILNSKIMSINYSIICKDTTNHIEYKVNNKTLLYLYEKEEFIECRININSNKIKSPKNIMGKYYNYGNYVVCYLHDKSDIEYTLLLIKQAI